MAVTVIPSSNFMWGCPEETPALPKGFVLVAKPDAFLTATGPDGRRWYVGPKKLTRLGVGGDEKDESHGFNAGKEYCDDREVIEL